MRGHRLGLAALAVFLSILLYAAGVFEPIDHRLAEARTRLLDRPPTGEIVIVEIDARSLAELRTWPWSRRYHATLVNNLHERGAALIAFDVDFSSRSEPVGDRAFAQAVRNAEPVILPIFQQRSSDASTATAIVESRPDPLFRAAWVGGVNIFPDAGGTVRDYPAATVIGGEIRPSIATLLAERGGLGDRIFQPDWSIDADRIPRLSFVDVMHNRVPRSAIAGKRIIVGATAVELGDRYVVPRYGNIPGVVIQALAAESILQDRPIARSAPLVAIAGILLVCGSLGLGRFARFNRSFPAAAIAACAIVAILPIVVQSRWPMSLDSAALWFGILVCVAGRTAMEIHRRIALRATGGQRHRSCPIAARWMPSLRRMPGPSTIAVAAIDRFDTIRDAMGIDGCDDAGRRNRTPSWAARRRAGLSDRPRLSWRGCRRATSMTIPTTSSTGCSSDFREPVATSDGPVDVQPNGWLAWQCGGQRDRIECRAGVGRGQRWPAPLVSRINGIRAPTRRHGARCR